MSEMTEQPTLLYQTAAIDLTVSVPAHVYLLRETRHRCPTCLRRRVLYRIDIPPFALTGAQCASCWGVR